MKRILFLLLLAMTFSLTACNDDDDGAYGSSDSQLLGTWKLTAWNTQTAFDIDGDGTASTNLLDEVDCLNNETLLFNSNNTMIVNSTSYLDIDIYLETGTTDSFVFDVECELENDNFLLTWTREGNTVSIIEEGFEDEELIAIINDDTLSIVLNDELDVYNDEFDLEFSEDLTIVYTRQ